MFFRFGGGEKGKRPSKATGGGFIENIGEGVGLSEEEGRGNRCSEDFRKEEGAFFFSGLKCLPSFGVKK